MPAITEIVLRGTADARSQTGFSHDLPVPFYRMLHGKLRAGTALTRSSAFLDFRAAEP